jgi:DNA primase
MVNHLSVGEFDEAVELAESLECADLQARLDAVLGDDEPEEETIFDESKLAPFARRVPRYAIDPLPEGRDLTIEACKEWELGYDELRCRLVVPVRNIDGDLVGMMGRTIYEERKPKWYAYWNFSKGRYLYGEHKIDPAVGRVIVTEGMPDVWRPWQFGYRNIVALLGSRLTFGHESKLLRWGMDVYWFLDGNEAGRCGTSQCIGLMRGKLNQYIIKCPEGKDPGMLTKEEMCVCIDEAEFVL